MQKITAITLALIVVAGTIGMYVLSGDKESAADDGLPLLEPVAGSNPGENMPWPMYQHDLHHTGYTDAKGNGNIANYGPLWHRTQYTGVPAPLVADLDGDGSLDVTHTTETSRDNTFRLYDLYGGEIWKHTFKSEMWGTPAIADLNDDGELDIVISTYREGKIAAFAGDGAMLWEHFAEGRAGGVAIADLDGDGSLETVFGDNAGYLYSIDNGGNLLWRTKIGDIAWFVPAIADLDQGGNLEIITGKYDKNGYGGIVALDHGGQEIWRFQTTGGTSEPTIGDVDRDGRYDILFTCDDGKTYCLDNLGMPMWDFDLDAGSYNSPCIANFDKDPDLEIIVTCRGRNIYMLNSKGEEIWTYRLLKGRQWNTPITADLDGDGGLEVICSYNYLSYNASEDFNGGLAIFDKNGNLIWKYDMHNDAYYLSIVDLNKDGSLEILANMGGHIEESLGNHILYSPSDGLWVFGDVEANRELVDQNPNLHIRYHTVDYKITGEKEITITAFVYNLGHKTKATNFEVEMWTNNNRTLIDTIKITELQPLTWTKIEAVYTYLIDLPRTVYITVDTGNNVAESDEKDNLAPLQVALTPFLIL